MRSVHVGLLPLCPAGGRCQRRGSGAGALLLPTRPSPALPPSSFATFHQLCRLLTWLCLGTGWRSRRAQDKGGGQGAHKCGAIPHSQVRTNHVVPCPAVTHEDAKGVLTAHCPVVHCRSSSINQQRRRTRRMLDREQAAVHHRLRQTAWDLGSSRGCMWQVNLPLSEHKTARNTCMHVSQAPPGVCRTRGER